MELLSLNRGKIFLPYLYKCLLIVRRVVGILRKSNKLSVRDFRSQAGELKFLPVVILWRELKISVMMFLIGGIPDWKLTKGEEKGILI